MIQQHQSQQEASEANKALSDLKKQMDKMKKANEALANRNAVFEAAERKKFESWKADQQQKATQAVATMASAMGQEKLDEEFVKGINSVFTDPKFAASQEIFSTLAAQLTAKKKQDERMAQIEQQMSELKKAKDANASFVQQTHASIMGIKKDMTTEQREHAKASDDAEQEKIALEASRNLGFGSVFCVSPNPSAEELELAGGSIRGGAPVIGVNASNVATRFSQARQVKRKETHGYEHVVPGSLAFKKETAAMWNWAMQQSMDGLRGHSRLVNHPDDMRRYSEHTNKAPPETGKMTWYK